MFSAARVNIMAVALSASVVTGIADTNGTIDMPSDWMQRGNVVLEFVQGKMDPSLSDKSHGNNYTSYLVNDDSLSGYFELTFKENGSVFCPTFPAAGHETWGNNAEGYYTWETTPDLGDCRKAVQPFRAGPPTTTSNSRAQTTSTAIAPAATVDIKGPAPGETTTLSVRSGHKNDHRYGSLMRAKKGTELLYGIREMELKGYIELKAYTYPNDDPISLYFNRAGKLDKAVANGLNVPFNQVKLAAPGSKKRAKISFNKAAGKQGSGTMNVKDQPLESTPEESDKSKQQ